MLFDQYAIFSISKLLKESKTLVGLGNNALETFCLPTLLITFQSYSFSNSLSADDEKKLVSTVHPVA